MPQELWIATDHQPSRADALKNRALLLDTARQLFAEHGVDAITMSAIAEAAGVGKGTLYRHFENKTALCQALLDDDQRQLQERSLRRLRQGYPPLDNLRWFLAEVVAFVTRNEDLLFGVHDRLPTLAHPAHLWWRQTIRGLLAQAHVEGDLDYLADVLYVMLDARTITFQRRSLGYSVERIVDGLHHLLARLA